LESITHVLTGAVLARAGFNRKSALATATMTLAAVAPDLDMLGAFKGPVFAFAHHRGFTHSFLGLVLVSAVVVGFIYCVWRFRGRKTNIPHLPPRWGLLFLFAYIAGASHILLDFTNSYGVRPFWPFWEKWYSWDIVFIVEPALYLLLLGALLAPLLYSRGKPIPHGRQEAIIALIAIVGLYAFRDHEHRKALASIKSMHFDLVAPDRVSAYPYFWNVFRWYAVAETSDFFATSDLDSRTGKLDLRELRFYHKQPDSPVTVAAKSSYAGRVYLDWAQYPWTSHSNSGDNTLVHFTDLRFDYPARRGTGTLSCTVELDGNLHVIGQLMAKRRQSPPID